MSTADRNRQIKKVLKQAFAPHSVSVTGDRGTAYGWVDVKIGYAPRDWREGQNLHGKVIQLIEAAGIKLSTYSSDMGGDRYEILIKFDTSREQMAAPPNRFNRIGHEGDGR